MNCTFSNTFLVYYRSLFRRLPQITAIKKMFNSYSFPVSLPSLFCFGFDLNQSQGTKPISRNGHGPDQFFVHGIFPLFVAAQFALKKSELSFHPHSPLNNVVPLLIKKKHKYQKKAANKTTLVGDGALGGARVFFPKCTLISR